MNSILEAGYPPQLVYCFDNGSQPEIYQQLKIEFPLCNFERIETNLGYSGGFNRSLTWVFSKGFSSALFCTNDTIVSAGAAEACEKIATQTGAGLVAPLITYISNKENIDSSGAYFDSTNGTLHHYHEYGLPVLLNPTTDYIPGTALWINKDAFQTLGGTDEGFHMYWEDVDLCFRASQNGIFMARSYDAVIRHGGGQTCRKKPLYTTFYFQRNRIRFCQRYVPEEKRENVLQLIRDELLNSGMVWEEKGDTQRLEYLEKLLNEF